MSNVIYNYEKAVSKLVEELKNNSGYVSVFELVDRFVDIDNEYNHEPWNLLQILANINMVTTVNSSDNSKWIPCSKRLPNESETWYLNIEEGIHEPNEFIVQVKGAELPTVAMFDGETFIHRYAENGYGFIGEIIAWQPLPEPYKGEQHEID